MPRIDKGLKRKTCETGYTAFQRKHHRANLQSHPGACDVKSMQNLADVQIRLAGRWTPEMQKEHNFQMQKVVRGVGEAWVSGGLLQSERSMPEVAVVGEEHKRGKKTGIF